MESENIGLKTSGNLLILKDIMDTSKTTIMQFFLTIMRVLAINLAKRIYFDFTKFSGKKMTKNHNISVSQKTVGEKFFFKKEMVIFAFPSKFFY